MEFDLPKTAAAFVAIIVVAVGALLAMDVMPPRITLMMVAPSMVAFGLICLGLGVLYGEHRAGSAH
ncbi:DUF7333 family protein [Halosimplex amylolyticum]|uniref:DUF7333 family protein n=1 Tax=Halosimplex amylolyticum TaxID=3396616 RepID=UPI003F576985